jgi:hypothetical protein
VGRWSHLPAPRRPKPARSKPLGHRRVLDLQTDSGIFASQKSWEEQGS